jgi:peptidoglycan/LPS O-acetylase OafA/YrhL
LRFNNIQILRLITAIGVVVAHTGYYGGHLFGVSSPLVDALWSPLWINFLAPTFFAISGFVLTQAIHATPPRRFLVARCLRVYPGYWLAAALTMGLMWFTIWPPQFREYVRPQVVGWTLLPHGHNACIYPLGVEWTLVYEIVLYLWMTVVAALVGIHRGLPIAAGVWLAVLYAKAAFWPGYGSVLLPTWGQVFCSAANAPFLVGVLAFYVRDGLEAWRWAAIGGLAGYLAAATNHVHSQEGHWLTYGPACAVGVWIMCQFRQVRHDHPLVRAGEYTYGLYLLHTPLLMGTFFLLLRFELFLGSELGMLVAGSVALTGGLLLGWLEATGHTRYLRPLLKVDWSAKWDRIRLAVMRRVLFRTQQKA